MEPTITATYKFDEQTMSRGRYWHWAKKPLLFWLSPLIGVFFTIFGVYMISHQDRVMATSWVILIMGVYLVFRYWIIGIKFRRDIRRNPQYGKPLIWTFSEEGLCAQAFASEMKSKWDVIYESYVTPDGFLLYPQKGIYYWIPRSAFAMAEEAEFVEETLKLKTRAKVIA